MYTMDRLKGIDVFVCVANVGSFSGAAERLSLTNSAVSKSIARLEKRLQTRLFNRTTRRLSLTDTGKDYYRTCAEVLGCLEEAEQSIRAEDTEPRGRVRVELPGAFGRVHVLPLLLEFLQQHPLLMPHISFSDHFIDPIEQGVDIVVRIGGPDDWPSLLGHRFIGPQRLVFCAAPQYLAQHGCPGSEIELEQHQCILYGYTDGGVAPWYFTGGQPGNLERRVMPGRIAVGDGNGLVLSALAGIGIAQLPTWLANEHLEKGELVHVLPKLAVDGLPMNIVWLKSRQDLPRVKALLQVLTACLTPLGWDRTLR